MPSFRPSSEQFSSDKSSSEVSPRFASSSGTQSWPLWSGALTRFLRNYYRADVPDTAARARSLALSSSTIKHYLPLILPLMPDLTTLILSCKMTLRDLALLEPPRLVAPPNVPLLAPAFSHASPSPAGQSLSMPNPTNLQLDISEPLSAGLVQSLLRSSLVSKVEDLSISARFIRAGLMVDVVELPQATIVCRRSTLLQLPDCFG